MPDSAALSDALSVPLRLDPWIEHPPPAPGLWPRLIRFPFIDSLSRKVVSDIKMPRPIRTGGIPRTLRLTFVIVRDFDPHFGHFGTRELEKHSQIENALCTVSQSNALRFRGAQRNTGLHL